MKLLRYSLLLFWFPLTVFGQSADTTLIVVGNEANQVEEVVTINGKVLTAVTGDPVPNVEITISGFSNTISGDIFGNFRLFIPPGKYTLILEHPDMVSIERRIHAFRSGAVTLEMNLPSRELEEVLVTAYAADTKVADVNAGIERMKLQDIEVQPAFMGEVDIVKSLQWLPGVSSGGEGSAGFNVRGGRIDQNLVLLEGAPLFNPTHLLGFFSAFQTDVVESFSLYKGHVPASFGGRAASVLDIQTRYGNPDSMKVSVGLGIVSARLAVEGPVGNGGGSFLVGGRSSYTNWVLRQAQSAGVSRSDAGFQDAYASMRLPFSEKSILEVFGYGSRDRVLFSDQFGFDYETGLAGAHWYYLPSPTLSFEVTGHAGLYNSDLVDPSGFDAGRATTGVVYYHGRQQAFWKPEKHALRVGLEQTMYDLKDPTRTPEGLQSAIQAETVQGDQAVELAAFVDDVWEITPKLSVSLGLRYVEYLQLGSETTYLYADGVPKSPGALTDSIVFGSGEVAQRYNGFEPRFSLRYRINEYTSVKASANRLQQFIHLISNTAAPTPVDIWQPSTVYLAPQITDQYSIGFFRNFDAHRWETSLEFFYKDQSQIIEYQDFASLLVNRFLETDLVGARGRAYGGEAIIRKKRGRLTGWLAYTYARSFVQTTSEFEIEQVNRGEWYPAPYDQPHQVDLVANIKLGNGSSFGLNGTYRKGRPFSAIETNFEAEGTVIPLFSDRNRYRIPDYFRIDISLTLGSIVKSWDDQLTLSVYNLLQRENAYSVFYQRINERFIPNAFKLAVLGSAFPALTYNINF